jgi:hypothetical protein
MESRALCLLGKCPTTEFHLQSLVPVLAVSEHEKAVSQTDPSQGRWGWVEGKALVVGMSSRASYGH